MRRRIRRIIGLVAVVVLAGVAATPIASARMVIEPSHACRDWSRAVSLSLAYAGIFGEQADSYLRSRADNPCTAGPLTPRSLFHAGDPA